MSPINRTLASQIRRLIKIGGPLTVAHYMNEALHNPSLGYYKKRKPFGKNGDFITAPEISQMFGEMIGAWCLDCWQKLGSPNPILLVELGPGRGTLLSDLWRVTSVSKEFRDAVQICLIEKSPTLKTLQQHQLSLLDSPPSPVWYENLSEVPDGTILMVANEFFDALPVHQFVSGDAGWRERMVDCDPDDPDRFRYVIAPNPTPATSYLSESSDVGEEVEISPMGLTIALEVATRISKCRGAALIVDFSSKGAGFSLQAVREHQYHDPLVAPGEADLACAVNFEQLSSLATKSGVSVHGPLGQGEFLRSLGIDRRAENLMKNTGFDRTNSTNDINSQLRRLTEPHLMGELFKVLAITSNELRNLPGFCANDCE